MKPEAQQGNCRKKRDRSYPWCCPQETKRHRRLTPMPIAEERPAPNIAGQFVQVEDPRGEQGKQHRLDDIISWSLPSVRSSVEPTASRPPHSLVKIGSVTEKTTAAFETAMLRRTWRLCGVWRRTCCGRRRPVSSASEAEGYALGGPQLLAQSVEANLAFLRLPCGGATVSQGQRRAVGHTAIPGSTTFLWSLVRAMATL